MGKRKIFPGSIYGYLTAEYKDPEDIRYWVCKCICGNSKRVFRSHLTNGKIRSCGCKSIELFRESAFENLSGHIFGKWLVLSFDKIKNGSYMWLCRCVCGNEVSVNSKSLRSGRSLSCKKCGRKTHGLSHTKEYSRAATNKRNERKQQVDGGWSVFMENSLRELFPCCVVCGSTDRMATDHVFPLSKGYGLAPGNAVRLCKSCNSTKTDRMPSDLPEPMRSLILEAAESFRLYWNENYT